MRGSPSYCGVLYGCRLPETCVTTLQGPSLPSGVLSEGEAATLRHSPALGEATCSRCLQGRPVLGAVGGMALLDPQTVRVTGADGV